MIPGHLDRTNHWLEKKDRGRTLPCKKTLHEYFETNVFLTTAGNFSTTALLQAISEVGSDLILFSVDTPFENITEGATWLDTLPISGGDQAKIGRHNSLQLFPRLSTRLRTAGVKNLQKQCSKALYLNQTGFPGKL
jgi:predicted TIM-barrel fold metal-dependent hydrolase